MTSRVEIRRSTDSELVGFVEASPASVTLKNVDFGYEGHTGEQFTLATPAGDRLRPR